jgi:hypothetical protein
MGLVLRIYLLLFARKISLRYTQTHKKVPTPVLLGTFERYDIKDETKMATTRTD